MTASLRTHQSDFIEFLLRENVLEFGNFTLKSGRSSPYFCNFGSIYEGDALSQLGHFYAEVIQDSGLSFDVLFGPAYKGIPLVCTTAIALSSFSQQPVDFSYNRKEPKGHGEGGVLVGAPLKGKVVIVDDVITAGTAIHESVKLIEEAGAELAGVVVALDRQERVEGGRSAIDNLVEQYQVPVVCVIQLTDLLSYLHRTPTYEYAFKTLKRHYELFGA